MHPRNGPGTMLTMPSRAITYARQSKQREDESQGSPEAQRLQTRALVDSRGWTFVSHYEDLGASGYDPKAARPGLDAALQAIVGGEADVLVVYRLDRLTRRGVGEAIRLVTLLRDNGASMVSSSEPFLDTSTPMGTGIFGLFAAMAEQESNNISMRSRGANRVLRAAGSHTSGRTPYGFAVQREISGKLTVRTLVPDPAEAGVVREVVTRVLAGESVASLARELNARDIRPRSGADWGTNTLSRLLRSPSLAGYMVAQRSGRNAPLPRDESGRALLQTDDDGIPLQPWTPIIEPAEWHRLQDVLDARPVTRGKTKEPSLLGGSSLLVCGRCGGGMGADRRSGGTQGNYRCMRHRRSGTCEGTTTSILPTEEHLVRAVFSRLATLDPEEPADGALLVEVAERFNARLVDPTTASERRTLAVTIETTRQALERLDDDRADGLFAGDTGDARYRRQVQALTARLDDAQRMLGSLPTPSLDVTPWLEPLMSADGGPFGPDSPWASWSIAEQREFLKLAVDRVEVLASKRRGTGVGSFRGEERLRIHWAGSAGRSCSTFILGS